MSNYAGGRGGADPHRADGYRGDPFQDSHPLNPATEYSRAPSQDFTVEGNVPGMRYQLSDNSTSYTLPSNESSYDLAEEKDNYYNDDEALPLTNQYVTGQG